jgi:hypothetical protein
MRIIKKYGEFLKEAIYAPPPPPPPAIYSTMDMQNAEKADDSGNYMFKIGDDLGKGDNKAAENQKIDPSEWGISDANLPETVEGWHSANDPFIKAYSNYLNDSTGTQKGYVGKTLLIFQKKDGKELDHYIEGGKIMGTETEMSYYYVTKDAVKYKVESSFKDGKSTITIFAGEKATRSFDLASGQMLVKKSAYDDLMNGDLINTPVESKDNGGRIVSYLPAAEPFTGKVNIYLNTNGSQLSVTDGVPSGVKIKIPTMEGSHDENAPVLLQGTWSKKNQRVFYISGIDGQVRTGSQHGFEVLPEVFAKHGKFAKLGVPGVNVNQIKPNIEGFGTVYAYKYIYKGTTKGNIIYRSNTPSEVEDSFGNTAKGNVEDGYYSVPLNLSRYHSYDIGHGAAGASLEYNVDDVNVHQPFRTDAGKKAISSIAGKNGKQIEVKWDAKAKKFVSDYKVIKSTLSDSERRQMIN